MQHTYTYIYTYANATIHTAVDKSSVEIKAATDIDSSNGKRKKKGKQQKHKQKEAEKKKPVILYDINTEVIHHRQYKGKCVEISKREFGEIGGKIAQSFAVHGKLSKLHLSEAIKQFDDDEQDEEEGISAQALMQAFNAMVSAKYIKRSDTIEASGQKKQKKRLELEEKAEENMKKKKKNKGDKEVSSSRVNSAAFAVEKAKEKAEEELQDKHGVDGDAGDGDKGGRTSKDGLDKEVVWELSYERFGWDRKKGMIVQYVNEHVAPRSRGHRQAHAGPIPPLAQVSLPHAGLRPHLRHLGGSGRVLGRRILNLRPSEGQEEAQGRADARRRRFR